ncbi:hypothetical protein D0Y65_031595 [Glycine soja]|uniref:Single-stranded DNA binding protein Ssb-like OB fold domain-containing protein n=1 Tax=Glycine soja TaxID=3848 RepID=A0A445I917_GLYSO|nr:hypothetical protein D0Y65_031595 [Glycine soja]
MASSNSAQLEGNKPAKRKPVFTKVDQLKPGTNGHTLVAKVLSSDTVVHKPRPSSAHNLKPTVIAECLIGDDTGTIVFTARNEQVFFIWGFSVFDLHCSGVCEITVSFSMIHLKVGMGRCFVFNYASGSIMVVTVDMMKAGATVIIRNAKIDMFKGSMRMAVDKWGRVEVTDPADFEVKEDNNLSLVEYELVNVVEE